MSVVSRASGTGACAGAGNQLPVRRGPSPLALAGWSAVAVGFVLLSIAEVDWLHRLPGEVGARAAVVLMARDGARSAGAPAWQSRAAGLATEREVLVAAVAGVVAEQAGGMAANAGGAAVRDADWLAGHFHAVSSCVQTAGSGPAARGILLVGAVRGGSAPQARALAAAWAQAYARRAAAMLPDLEITRQETLRAPIRRCD